MNLSWSDVFTIGLQLRMTKTVTPTELASVPAMTSRLDELVSVHLHTSVMADFSRGVVPLRKDTSSTPKRSLRSKAYASAVQMTKPVPF